MPKIQGEFATSSEAKRAAQALEAAGVPNSKIHTWNIIPESPPPAPPGNGAQRTGALAGAVVGGLPGLALGATLGRAVDAAYADGPHVAAPTGVRVVVDDPPAGCDVAAILRSSGASNVG